MFRRFGSLIFSILGALIIIGAFYEGTARLWKAAQEARASSLEKTVVSAAMGDLAEGNLLRLGSTLSKLQREGQIRYAAIRHLGPENGTLFQTSGQALEAEGKLAGFDCRSPHLLFPASRGGVGLVTVLPTKISGGQCDALVLTADMPEELSRFRDRLLSNMTFFVSLIVGFVAFITVVWHRRVLRLEVQNSLVEAEREIAIGRLASQVAHDIRSPLAALDTVLDDVSQLPEDKRVLIRAAAGRIRDIANNLLDKNKTGAIGEPDAARLLSSLVDSVITEKRLQYRSKAEVEIAPKFDVSSCGLFVRIPPSDLQRVLSNLINNAVEALPGEGRVTVFLASAGDLAEIRVHDDGKGIPPELLARLGRRGETHGKPSGSGLGLYHARTSVEAWGGTFSIVSTPGNGTTATIRLPTTKAPDWFVSGLRISPGSNLVVLDDDASIHQVWRGRFASVLRAEHRVKTFHLSTPDEIRSWVRDQPRANQTDVFLLDYELPGFHETGLSLAEELVIGTRTILVTSRHEEAEIRSECLRIGARMMPKGMAGSLPIFFNQPGRLDAVLIDDDPLARMTWKLSAERAGKTLRAFATLNDFLKEADSIDHATLLYVDAELGDGKKGEEEALRLHGLGFTTIYLATGHAPEKFTGLSHLKGVIGKDPPWA